MNMTFWLFFLVFLGILQSVESKRKGKIKIGKKINKNFGKNAVKKIEKLFIGKKHHNKKKTPNTPPAIPNIIQSIVQSTSMPEPTATTFFSYFTASEILITMTDRDYNYYYGYPTNLDGVNYYQNSNFLVAGQRNQCGCCDNKVIIVTRALEDRLI